MRKIIATLALVLCLGQAFGQELNLTVTETYPWRTEAGFVLADTIGPNSRGYITTGAGWFTGPYFYIGLGGTLTLVQNLNLGIELYPVLSSKHRDAIERGNGMVGDEYMFGTRVRVGPQYTIRLWPELDLLIKAGVELECPIFATRNAAAELKVQGYVGLGLILHTL